MLVLAGSESVAYAALYLVFAGFAAGLLFGVGMPALRSFLLGLLPRYRPRLREGERLLREDGANYRSRGAALGGFLYLTNGQPCFASHDLNHRQCRLSVPLEGVTGVRPARMSRLHLLSPTGLELETERGAMLFGVEDREGWRRDLEDSLRDGT